MSIKKNIANIFARITNALPGLPINRNSTRQINRRRYGDTVLQDEDILRLPIVQAAMNFVGNKIIKGIPRTYKYTDDQKDFREHPALQLLMNPNEDDDGKSLMWDVNIEQWLKPKSYIRIYRENEDDVTSMPVCLYRYPYNMVEPKRNRDSNRIVDYYTVRTSEGQKDIPRENMIVVKMGSHLLSSGQGYDLLDAISEDAFVVSQITKLSGRIMLNMGVPSGILTPKEPLDEDDYKRAEEILEGYKPSSTNAGELMLLNGELNIQQLGFEPSKLALSDQLMNAESHILATLRVNASLIGATVGLKYDNTRASRAEALKESFTEIIIPLQESFSAAITKQLINDPYYVNLVGDDWGFEFDNSNVEELNIGINERWERIGKAFDRGIFSVDEYRSLLGFDLIDIPETREITYLTNINNNDNISNEENNG